MLINGFRILENEADYQIFFIANYVLYRYRVSQKRLKRALIG